MEEFLIEHIWVIVLVAVWTVVWTGLALWRAARLGHKYWFVAFLLINTVGILEILYLYVFSRHKRVVESTDNQNE